MCMSSILLYILKPFHVLSLDRVPKARLQSPPNVYGGGTDDAQQGRCEARSDHQI